ncbi:MAG: diacylglycerol kinase family protein [Myxococcota bacterium]
MRVGLLSNLRAGRNARRTARLLNFLRDYPDVVSVETTAAGAVPEALDDLARQDVELLIVNGGDGTLTHTLTEILGRRSFGDRVPIVAPLRGGRTNMSAQDLGSHKDPVRGLADLLQAVKTGHIEDRITSRPVLKVDYGSPGESHYGMFFGVGMIHRAIQVAHENFPARKGQGVLGSTLLTASLIARNALGDSGGVLRPDKIDLRLDGMPSPYAEFTLLIASTLDRLFAGMKPFWGTGPGALQTTSLASDCERIGAAAPGIWRGQPAAWVQPETGYLSRNVDSIRMRMGCGFTIDGELFDPENDSTVCVSANDSVRFART